jgi:hypothetical protein
MCVLVLVHMCPRTRIYDICVVIHMYDICVLIHICDICVLIHTSRRRCLQYALRACVSSYYYYMCVRMLLYYYLLYVCPRATIYVSSYCCVCPRTTIYVSPYSYMRDRDRKHRARPPLGTLYAHTYLIRYVCIPHTQRMQARPAAGIHTSYATYAYLIRSACRQGPRQAYIPHTLRMHTSYAAHAGKARGRQPI